MLTKVNADDLTIHHELGHNCCRRAFLTNSGSLSGMVRMASAGRSVIGAALSDATMYRADKALLDKAKVPAAVEDIALLLRQAMDKVALPALGLLMDE